MTLPERIRVALLACLLFSVPLLIVGAVRSVFWIKILRHPESYRLTTFEFERLDTLRPGGKAKQTIALGRIDGKEEGLVAWRDYFKSKQDAQKSVGIKLDVMFDGTATRAYWGGSDLRILSLTEFEHARRNLLGCLGLAFLLPLIALGLYLYGFKIRKASSNAV